ncbi:hypothetical protein FALBO_3904 [Fusarium albosuccineum]|uniref:Uncharacterized protein n=1 Tax=Fusarium albosuccineum TaxID=1237068 RepID=A0A8H4LI66_9HYPO|nr:hypothetical protein FALBO_3904 [Fusarium albosuccineum]
MLASQLKGTSVNLLDSSWPSYRTRSVAVWGSTWYAQPLAGDYLGDDVSELPLWVIPRLSTLNSCPRQMRFAYSEATKVATGATVVVIIVIVVGDEGLRLAAVEDVVDGGYAGAAVELDDGGGFFWSMSGFEELEEDVFVLDYRHDVRCWL